MASITSEESFCSNHINSPLNRKHTNISKKLKRFRKRDPSHHQSLFYESTDKVIKNPSVSTTISLNDTKSFTNNNVTYHQHFHGQTISRQLCNIWCGLLHKSKIVKDYGIINKDLVKDIQIPVNFLHNLFNKINLFPTNLQILKMLRCARNSTRLNDSEKYLTFGEFCFFGNGLKRINYLNEFKLNVLLQRNKLRKNPEVFLGGSCNPTTWRADIAIPTLKKLGISFYNPQVKYWSPDLIAAEHVAKESASLLFFMIDNQTRNIAGMIETAYLAAANRNVVLVIYPYVRNQYIMDEILSFQEYGELTEARELLLSLARRKNINVFNNLKLALKFVDWLFNENLNVDKHLVDGFNELRKVFNYFDFERKGRLSITQFTFACRKLLNYSLSFSDLKNILDNLPNCNKTISFDQFCSIVSELNQFDIESQSNIDLDKSVKNSSHEMNLKQKNPFIVQVMNKTKLQNYDILIGGTTRNANWRNEFVLPILKNHNKTFYDPCLSSESIFDEFKVKDWQLFEHILDKDIYFNSVLTVEILDNYLKFMNQCTVALFVITADSSSVTEMLIASYFIGLKFKTVLCVQTLPSGCQLINGKQLTESALKDYNRGRLYLIDLAKRENIPIFDSIKEATLCAIELSYKS